MLRPLGDHANVRVTKSSIQSICFKGFSEYSFRVPGVKVNWMTAL